MCVKPDILKQTKWPQVETVYTKQVQSFLLSLLYGEIFNFEKGLQIRHTPCTVIAKYPFLKYPMEFLTARHNNSNNYDQALKV